MMGAKIAATALILLIVLIVLGEAGAYGEPDSRIGDLAFRAVIVLAGVIPAALVAAVWGF